MNLKIKLMLKNNKCKHFGDKRRDKLKNRVKWH